MAELSPSAFVEMLAPAVRQAASIARALEGRVPNRPKPSEASAVKQALTIADSAAQEAILVPLLEHFPGVSLRAEEDTPSVSSFGEAADELVVIDPIDGTLRSYLEARGPYAVMVGLARGGLYQAALVALPREGLFFDGVRGGPARITRPRGEPRPVTARADGQRVLVSYEMPEPVLAHLRGAGFEVAYGCGGAISVAPLIPGVRAGLRLVDSIDGISIRGRIGALISREAGALVEGAAGRPFPEPMDEPNRVLAVAAEAEDLAILREAVARVL